MQRFFFYRAMHYSAKRGLAIACCPSVCDVVIIIIIIMINNRSLSRQQFETKTCKSNLNSNLKTFCYSAIVTSGTTGA